MNIKIINPLTYEEPSNAKHNSSNLLLCLDTPKSFQNSLINLINLPSAPNIIYIPSPNIFWNTDFMVYNETIEKTLKKIDNIHYLNNSHVKLNNKKEEYRILGSLMWNDYSHLSEEFVTISLIKSLHFSRIKANTWFENPYNLEQFNRLNEQLRKNNIYNKTFQQYYKAGFFHPIISYLMYQESLLYIKNELKKPFSGKTILLTHNHPTDYSIYLEGIQTATKDSKIFKALGKKQHIEQFIGRKSSLEKLTSDYKIDYIFNGNAQKQVNYRFNGCNIFSCDFSEFSINLNSNVGNITISSTLTFLIEEHEKYINALKDGNSNLLQDTHDLIDIIESYSFISSLLSQYEWRTILSDNSILIKEISKDSIGVTREEIERNQLNPNRVKMLISFISQNYYSLQLLFSKYEKK